MRVGSFTSFRRLFSPRVQVGPINCTFLASGGGGPAIVRTDAGSFVVDGFVIGMSAEVLGTVDNNLRFSVEGFATHGSPDDTLVLAADDAVTAEVCFTTTVDGVYIDGDGLELWPLALVRKAGSGFGDAGSTITGIPSTFGGETSFFVSCNTGAADAAPGVDEYDWYLSQRSDDAAAQYLTIAQRSNIGVNSYSGTVIVASSTLAATHFDLTSSADEPTLRALFKRSHLYVRRRSDGAIQWVDIYTVMTAP